VNVGDGNAWPSEVSHQLERLFRHVLPGLAIVGLAFSAYPEWFAGVCWNEPWHLATLAVVSVVVGNAWFLIHRYTIEQLLDAIAFKWSCSWCQNYRKDVAQRLAREMDLPQSNARHYFFLRSAHTSFLFIVSEAAFISALAPASESVVAKWRLAVLAAAVVTFIAALVQFWLLAELNREIASSANPGTEK
jgi:hypothetical protein